MVDCHDALFLVFPAQPEQAMLHNEAHLATSNSRHVPGNYTVSTPAPLRDRGQVMR